jgi:hypothetical protein
MKLLDTDVWVEDAQKKRFFSADVYEDDKIGLIVLVKSPIIQFPIGKPKYRVLFVRVDHLGKVLMADSWEEV